MSRVAETVEIPKVDGDIDYARITASADFRALRGRFLRFVVPMTVTYLLWYLLFVLVAMYAPGFMAIKVAGDLTVGLVMGGLQFLSTFALAGWYVRYANTTLDPAAAAIREAVGAGRLGAHPPAEAARPDPGAAPPPPERRDGRVSPTGHRIRRGIA